MENNDRATRGGVGAVMSASALVALALVRRLGLRRRLRRPHRPSRLRCRCSSFRLPRRRRSEADATAPISLPTPTPTEPAGFPYISARSIAVIEGACGAEIYGRDEHMQLPPASLTKLMTAAVATDQADTDQDDHVARRWREALRRHRLDDHGAEAGHGALAARPAVRPAAPLRQRRRDRHRRGHQRHAGRSSSS